MKLSIPENTFNEIRECAAANKKIDKYIIYGILRIIREWIKQAPIGIRIEKIKGEKIIALCKSITIKKEYFLYEKILFINKKQKIKQEKIKLACIKKIEYLGKTAALIPL